LTGVDQSGKKRREGRRFSEQMAINMRTMGTILVRKVRDALQMADAQNGEEEHSIVQFQAQENGCKANEKAGRIQDSLD